MSRLRQWLTQLREWWQDRQALAFIWEEVVSCPLRIVTGAWGISQEEVDGFIWVANGGRNGTVCPMGAMLLGTKASRRHYEEDAAALLGVDEWWVNGFVDGFDSAQATYHDDIVRERLYMRGFAVGQIIHIRAAAAGLLRKEDGA